MAPVVTHWKEQFIELLRDFTERTPGSLVEEKPAGLAWHYRMVEFDLARRRAEELHRRLLGLVGQTPVEILLGHAVIELRVRRINKGLVVAGLEHGRGLIAAVGDDQTDEDMFQALPPQALSIRVGSGQSVAGHRLPDHHAVRALLSALVES